MLKIRTLLYIPILFIPGLLFAGAANPNISVIGQFISNSTDDKTSQDKNTPTLGLGETEIQCDAPLNPYSSGVFVFSIDNGQFSVEEAYINIFNGLPDGFAVKAGKYRIGFGKLNPVHPHDYAFITAPRVMASMLPGDDGYDDTGAQLSYLFPTPGSWASNLSFDVLNGSSFHPDQTKTANAWVGRWTNSFLINDITPLDIGFSATEGTNDTDFNTKTKVYGLDIKTKIPVSPSQVLTLQGEYFYNDSDVLVDSNSLTGDYNRVGRRGFYAFANMKFSTRWNGGAIYDQYQPADNTSLTDSALKYFVGYSFLEETTVLRLAYEDFMPQDSPDVHTWSFQLLFMMGPHKAHQF
jgi:hypothetical protein